MTLSNASEVSACQIPTFSSSALICVSSCVGTGRDLQSSSEVKARSFGFAEGNGLLRGGTAYLGAVRQFSFY